jgi:hypothetical protein
MAYQIKDWSVHYENAKSRTVRVPSWCSMPNQQDGLSYRRMVGEHPEYYAVFVAIVLACSKQPSENRHGWLTSDGESTSEAWTPEDISLKIGMTAALIGKALDYLCSDKIGWLVKDPKPEAKRRMKLSGDGDKDA